MSGLSITTSITRMTYFTRVVSRSRSMNNVSKLFTTPTTNEDLASSEDNIRHVHPLEEKPNNNTRTLGCLLIDSVDEAKEESDKFTKVIEASTHNLINRFLVENVVQSTFYISILLKKETLHRKLEPNQPCRLEH